MGVFLGDGLDICIVYCVIYTPFVLFAIYSFLSIQFFFIVIILLRIALWSFLGAHCWARHSEIHGMKRGITILVFTIRYRRTGLWEGRRIPDRSREHCLSGKQTT